MTITRFVDIENILHRPRVSYKISEYVWLYIYKNYLKGLNILTDNKYSYRLNLSFSKYNPDIHKFFFDSQFNTEQNKFWPEKRFNTINKIIKQADIDVVSIYLDENIQPKDYADIVYDMFGAFLVEIYKKVKKVDMDNMKEGMDYKYIESFSFPAPFDEQRYFLDNNVYTKTISNGIIQTVEEINPKDIYIKHWKI